ncbi:MAG: M24 family metallopeptidase, partial [Acidimicrobiia bacterium]
MPDPARSPSRGTGLLEEVLHRRVEAVQRSLHEQGIGLFIASERCSTYWLGHPRAPFVCITPATAQAAGEAEVPGIIRRAGAVAVGVESGLAAGQLIGWQSQSGTGLRWRTMTGVMRNLRAVKDAVEVPLVARAAELSARALAALLHGPIPGRAEHELLADYLAFLYDAGSDGEQAFDPSFATGERTSLLWAGVSARRIGPGDPLTIDVGSVFRGYRSDVARSAMVVEEARNVTADWRQAFAAVRGALSGVLDACRPGVPLRHLASVCESELDRRGHPGGLRHLLGHGVGLEAHELPVVSKEA